MKSSSFYTFFLDFLADIYDAENQIVKTLPMVIQKVSDETLKKGLIKHLEETKAQVTRLNEVFSLLGEKPSSKTCEGMKGLIKEGQEVLSQANLTHSVRDCFTIVACQKIEHYEIASYGSAIALVKHLKSACPDDADYERILDLLDESLDEEGKADKTLTAAAEGKMFMKGVNDEIEKEISSRV